jgi:ribose 5-phosphate isomerase B
MPTLKSESSAEEAHVNGRGKPIVIGADHLGRELKDKLREHLCARGYGVVDMGVNSDDPVDYPDIGSALAEEVRAGKYDRGVLVCGTGAGMAIVANKVPGVRAVCVADPYTAERARASNNAQIITFGSLVIGVESAKKLLDIWLESEFQAGRSLPKVQKITALDAKYRGTDLPSDKSSRLH